MQKQMDGKMNAVCVNRDLSCINCIYGLDRFGNRSMCRYDEEIAKTTTKETEDVEIIATASKDAMVLVNKTYEEISEEDLNLSPPMEEEEKEKKTEVVKSKKRSRRR